MSRIRNSTRILIRFFFVRFLSIYFTDLIQIRIWFFLTDESGTGATLPGSGPGATLPGSGTGVILPGSGPGATLPGSGTGVILPGSRSGATQPGSGTDQLYPDPKQGKLYPDPQPCVCVWRWNDKELKIFQVWWKIKLLYRHCVRAKE